MLEPILELSEGGACRIGGETAEVVLLHIICDGVEVGERRAGGSRLNIVVEDHGSGGDTTGGVVQGLLADDGNVMEKVTGAAACGDSVGGGNGRSGEGRLLILLIRRSGDGGPSSGNLQRLARNEAIGRSEVVGLSEGIEGDAKVLADRPEGVASLDGVEDGACS